jgi:hypothetical protein
MFRGQPNLEMPVVFSNSHLVVLMLAVEEQEKQHTDW